MYWVTTNVWTVAQTLLFANSAFRKTIGILPPPKSVEQTAAPSASLSKAFDSILGKTEKVPEPPKLFKERPGRKGSPPSA